MQRLHSCRRTRLEIPWLLLRAPVVLNLCRLPQRDGSVCSGPDQPDSGFAPEAGCQQ